MNKGKRVIILGGGVAGMSAAHELIERGFDVEVYERKATAGGKARSVPVFEKLGDHGSASIHGPAVDAWAQKYLLKGPSGNSAPWLPGEHGFRFFPNFYKHVIDTMERTPCEKGTVADHLTCTTSVLLARYDEPNILAPARFPRTPGGIHLALRDLQGLLTGEFGIPLDEVAFFASRVWQIITSCKERRFAEYEKTGWWGFIGADSRSEAYKKLLGHGITRSLVAAQAQLASTKTIGDIFVQLLFGIINPAVASSDRVLDGPTTKVWIRPWLDYLVGRGVKYHTESAVQVIHCRNGEITGVTVEGSSQPVTADYYLAAMPVERLTPLINSNLTAADPALANIGPLARNVAWMNGLQFYLTRDVPINHGHAIYIDSAWAITTVSQRQFWPEEDLSRWGDGKVKGIISVDISDFNAIGLNGKAAKDCTRQEIADEVWQELKLSLNKGGQTVLRDEDLYYWFLDSDLSKVGSATGLLDNHEPLLVNLVDTWKLRPEAVTAIPNLFLASDYVRTYTDLATMEGANEAARRAVNGIIERSGSNAPFCRLWDLHEPEVFMPFRHYDEGRFRAGQPWDDQLMNTALSILGMVHNGGGNAALPHNYARPEFETLLKAAQGVTAAAPGGGLRFVQR